MKPTTGVALGNADSQNPELNLKDKRPRKNHNKALGKSWEGHAGKDPSDGTLHASDRRRRWKPHSIFALHGVGLVDYVSPTYYTRMGTWELTLFMLQKLRQFRKEQGVHYLIFITRNNE